MKTRKPHDAPGGQFVEYPESFAFIGSWKRISYLFSNFFFGGGGGGHKPAFLNTNGMFAILKDTIPKLGYFTNPGALSKPVSIHFRYMANVKSWKKPWK